MGYLTSALTKPQNQFCNRRYPAAPFANAFTDRTAGLGIARSLRSRQEHRNRALRPELWNQIALRKAMHASENRGDSVYCGEVVRRLAQSASAIPPMLFQIPMGLFCGGTTF